MKKNERSYAQELLDLGPSYYTQEEYDDCLNQLARIGRFLGGDAATFQAFKTLKTLSSVLDVGCGGGQFAIQLAKHFPLSQVVGIDTSTQAIEFAKKRLQEASLRNVTFEASSFSQLACEPKSFDVVTSTLVCHHLKDDELVEFLKKSYKVAKKAVIINDLHRSRLAYAGFWLISKLFFPNRLIVHDGLLSIKRGFKKQDWIRYLKDAEIPLESCVITWHWAFRWVLYIKTDLLEKA